MKIDARYQVEKTASSNPRRAQICQAYLDTKNPEKPVIVTTDCHAMSVVPVVLDPQDVGGNVPLDVLAEARRVDEGRPKGHPAKGTIQIAALYDSASLEDGRTWSRGDEQFPQWRDVVDLYTQDRFCVQLDPYLLLRACEAIGVAKDRSSVTLRFQKDPESAIRVECGDAFAIVMPIRGPRGK